MPGWHARTRELQRSGRLQIVGVIQEQHPDRCALFQQWHRMEWPVLVDALNLLGVSAVPLSFLLDEQGVIQVAQPGAADLEAFLERPPASEALPASKAPPAAETPPASKAPPAAETSSVPDATPAEGAGKEENDPLHWLRAGDSAFLGGRWDEAFAGYTRSLDLDPTPEAYFRLGVTARRRYETQTEELADFARALEAWGEALRRRPNQYIWRRRIQQYGPRLNKPYSFYDWVTRAREEITARGDTPHRLPVEPTGAEFAHPAKAFAATEPGLAPDPDGRVRRDTGRLVALGTAVAPTHVAAGGVARLHIVLRPGATRQAHWDNEAGPTRVWLEPPPGCTVDERELTVSGEARQGARSVECEVRLDESVRGEDVTVSGYALYFVCEGATGTCQFLRQDFDIVLAISR